MDTSEKLDVKILYRNAQIIVKTLVAHLYDYNMSEVPKIVSWLYLKFYHLNSIQNVILKILRYKTYKTKISTFFLNFEFKD